MLLVEFTFVPSAHRLKGNAQHKQLQKFEIMLDAITSLVLQTVETKSNFSAKSQLKRLMSNKKLFLFL